MMNNGIIDLDTERGKMFGFTSDKYDGYLWKDNDRVLISFIATKQEGKGHLSELFGNIEKAGFRVAVPTPLGRMQSILEKKGFVMTLEHDAVFNEPSPIWMKPKETP